VAQATEQPSLDDQHRDFDLRLVAWPTGPCRQDRGIVMRRHLGVGSIDLRLIKAGLDDGDLGVVRHEQFRHPAQRRESAGMSADSVDQCLGPARLGIEPAPAKAGVKLEAPMTATKICAGRTWPVSRSTITGTVSPA
jgi:hypothetical protein